MNYIATPRTIVTATVRNRDPLPKKKLAPAGMTMKELALSEGHVAKLPKSAGPETSGARKPASKVDKVTMDLLKEGKGVTVDDILAKCPKATRTNARASLNRMRERQETVSRGVRQSKITGGLQSVYYLADG